MLLNSLGFLNRTSWDSFCILHLLMEGMAHMCRHLAHHLSERCFLQFV